MTSPPSFPASCSSLVSSIPADDASSLFRSGGHGVEVWARRNPAWLRTTATPTGAVTFLKASSSPIFVPPHPGHQGKPLIQLLDQAVVAVRCHPLVGGTAEVVPGVPRRSWSQRWPLLGARVFGVLCTLCRRLLGFASSRSGQVLPPSLLLWEGRTSTCASLELGSF